MIENQCRCNPWAESMLLCRMCQDTGRVAANRDSRGSSACPECSPPEKRALLVAAKHRREMPSLRRSELTEEEEAIVKEWRARGYHELDCLRWIEGRRYDPEKDPEFRRELHKALVKAAFLHEQPEPSFKP